jgi:hypothetical protein
MEMKSLASWLDENVSDWRSLSADELDTTLRAKWKAGAFRKLRVHTRNSPAEAVLVGVTHYAYIEF